MNDTLTLKQRFKLSRFISGEAAGSTPIILSHRRIFILPTQRGYGFIFFIGLLILLAFVYNNNLAYLLGFLMGSVFFVSTLHSFKALAGIQVSPGKNKAVFAGETAAFAIHIDNPAHYPRINLQVQANDTSMVATDISSNSNTSIALLSLASQRGEKQLGTVTLVSYFPLGLLRAWSPINFQSSILVYPEPSQNQLPFPETFSPKHQQGQGASKSARDDFYQCQTYQAGDPIRQIHWKAFAKQQVLLSKKYSGETSAEIWLDFTMAPGQNLEDKLSQLCRWIIDASSANIDYGLRLPNINNSPNNNHDHRHKCLEALALFKY